MTSRSDGAQLAGLKLYGRLPPLMRQRFVRAVKPSFTVGTMTVVTRADGALLLVRHSYLSYWSFPGGLLNRRELVEVGAARETREEVGIRIVLVGEPAVVVDPFRQVVRVIYRAGLANGVSPEDAHPASPEIVEVGWFPPESIAGLASESGDALEALLRAERSRH
ncbi:MAG: NUDIX domain-containing protein [Acidimicrobiales bacterium]